MVLALDLDQISNSQNLIATSICIVTSLRRAIHTKNQGLVVNKKSCDHRRSSGQPDLAACQAVASKSLTVFDFTSTTAVKTTANEAHRWKLTWLESVHFCMEGSFVVKISLFNNPARAYLPPTVPPRLYAALTHITHTQQRPTRPTLWRLSIRHF